jgi:hypothetical protein
MSLRTKTRTVTFSHPFFIAEIDRELPAGAYTIEVDEQKRPGASIVGYRRVGTRMVVPARAGTGFETWLIRPDGLQIALDLDRAAPGAA